MKISRAPTAPSSGDEAGNRRRSAEPHRRLAAPEEVEEGSIDVVEARLERPIGAADAVEDAPPAVVRAEVGAEHHERIVENGLAVGVGEAVQLLHDVGAALEEEAPIA